MGLRFNNRSVVQLIFGSPTMSTVPGILREFGLRGLGKIAYKPPNLALRCLHFFMPPRALSWLHAGRRCSNLSTPRLLSANTPCHSIPLCTARSLKWVEPPMFPMGSNDFQIHRKRSKAKILGISGSTPKALQQCQG